MASAGVHADADPATEEEYLSREHFLETAFDGMVPDAQLLWLTRTLRDQLTSVLGHPPAAARLRYWRVAGRSAWVLDEIGKERPITVGVVVDGGRIHNLRILTYRESRGWEVRNDFFTHQFEGARLDDKYSLDRNIDNVSGATLSVDAVRRLARVALMLDRHVRNS